MTPELCAPYGVERASGGEEKKDDVTIVYESPLLCSF